MAPLFLLPILVAVLPLVCGTPPPPPPSPPSSPPLHDCVLSTRHNRKTADCRGLSLVAPPGGLDGDVKVLQLGSNRLRYLGADAFAAYRSLQGLELDGNQIAAVAPHAFRGLRNLRRLDLSSNRLATVPAAALTHVPNVRELVLRANPLTYVARGAFASLHMVERLELGDCGVTRVAARAFTPLVNLRELDLAGNALRTVPRIVFPPRLRVLRLYDNPWTCDCHLRWLRVWLSGRAGGGGDVLNWHFGSNTPRCAAPDRLRGRPWHAVEARRFACAPAINAPGDDAGGGGVVLARGANVTLVCSARGDPRPTTGWVPLGAGAVTRTEQGDTGVLTSLRLENITTAADYTCFAQNSAGRHSLVFAIRLRRPPPPAPLASAPLNPIYVAIATVAVGTMIIAIAFAVICCAAKHCLRGGTAGKYEVHDPDDDLGDDKRAAAAAAADDKPTAELLVAAEMDGGDAGEFTMRIFSHSPVCADDDARPLVAETLATPDLLRSDAHSPYLAAARRAPENAYARPADLKPAIRSDERADRTAELKPALRTDVRSDSDSDGARPAPPPRPRNPVTFSDDVQVQTIPGVDTAERHCCAAPCRNPVCQHKTRLTPPPPPPPSPTPPTMARSNSATSYPRHATPVRRQTSVDGVSPVRVANLDGSPPRKPARTYQSTSLDDILAPPFQSPNKGRDEFGTSV